jgi:hypothetical protein
VRDAADEAKHLRTGVDEAVLLIAGHVDGVVGGQIPFALIPSQLAPSGKYEHLVLPPVGMKGGRGAWLHLKHPHREVGGAILGGYDGVEGYPRDLPVRRDVSVVANLHFGADSFHSGWSCYRSY